MYLQFVVYFHYLFLIKTTPRHQEHQQLQNQKNMMKYVLLFNPNELEKELSNIEYALLRLNDTFEQFGGNVSSDIVSLDRTDAFLVSINPDDFPIPLEKIGTIGGIRVEVISYDEYKFNLNNDKNLKIGRGIAKNKSQRNEHEIRRYFIFLSLAGKLPEFWNVIEFACKLEKICHVYKMQVSELFGDILKEHSFSLSNQIDEIFRDFGRIAGEINKGKLNVEKYAGKIVNWKSFTMKFIFEIMELVDSYGLIEITSKESKGINVTILDYYTEWCDVFRQSMALSKNMCKFVIRQMKTLMYREAESVCIILTNKKLYDNKEYNDFGISMKEDYCKEAVRVSHQSLKKFRKYINDNYEDFFKDMKENLTVYSSEPSKFEEKYGIPYEVFDEFFQRKEKEDINLLRFLATPHLRCNVIMSYN